MTLLTSGLRYLYVVGILSFVGILVLIAVLAFQSEGELNDSFKWVSHTLEVESQIKTIYSTLMDAETGQRGYLLTGRDVYLKPYKRAASILPVEMKSLGLMTVNDPEQRANFSELEININSRMRLLEEVIILYNEQNKGEAITLLANDKGLNAMSAIQGKLDRMVGLEKAALIRHQEKLMNKAEVTLRFLIGLIVLMVFLTLCIFFLVYRINKLQSLVTMCAWSRTVEFEGKWLPFEEYLERRFKVRTSHGISPTEVQKEIKRIADKNKLKV